MKSCCFGFIFIRTKNNNNNSNYLLNKLITVMMPNFSIVSVSLHNLSSIQMVSSRFINDDDDNNNNNNNFC